MPPGSGKSSNGNVTKKRKEPTSSGPIESAGSTKKIKVDHRAKQRDARSLATQTSFKAFKHGELDVDKFVKAREFEIRALEEGMSQSKKALTTRAFQQVPKELRRRTASHNDKWVPRRLRARAKREMIEDNTPTVTARRRKITRHMRLRLENVKKLRAINSKRKRGTHENAHDDIVRVNPLEKPQDDAKEGALNKQPTRGPKEKTQVLRSPPVPRAKFRKRQINKTWLPTHMFHAKRAHLTPPKEPLWGFALPIKPTAKCYRAVHRTTTQRGALAWDVSYFATIGLEGQQRSITGVMNALRIGSQGQGPGAPRNVSAARGNMWKQGLRIWEGLAHEHDPPHHVIGPVVAIWAVDPKSTSVPNDDESKHRRQVFIRIHASAFRQLWCEVVRLSKTVKPHISVQDLRYEIGGIDITGPDATEALLAALWPSQQPAATGAEQTTSAMGKLWRDLAGLSNPGLLPVGALLAFEIDDPRLRHPPRKASKLSDDADDLLQLIATWSVDTVAEYPKLFDPSSRTSAASSLPSQRSINRRKASALPGRYPAAIPKDPKIPTLLYVRSLGRECCWTVLLPWKCVQPVWYNIIYCPLLSGGQPRFGGLREQKQIAFEAGQPWFPGDYPATQAGWHWELKERSKRYDEWKRKPKSKRHNWETLKLREDEKGEIGRGWACDWTKLLPVPMTTSASTSTEVAQTLPHGVFQLDRILAQRMVVDPSYKATLPHGLSLVRLTLVTRGVVTTCARIYKLPSEQNDAALRQQWLAQVPDKYRRVTHKTDLPRVSSTEPAYLVQRRLAQALLEPPRVGDDSYPQCPPAQDLVGFVTTGTYDLSAGQGTAIGSILFTKVVDDMRKGGEQAYLCVVRNAGNTVGRLARFAML